MRRGRYFLLGLLLSIAGGALAVSGGGLPSNPIFRIVTAITGAFSGTVTSAHSVVSGAAPQVQIKGTGTGGASVSYEEFDDSVGARNGYFGCTANGGPGNCVWEADNGNILLFPKAGTGQGVFTSPDGGTTLIGLPRVARTAIGGIGSGCSFTGPTVGVTGCTHTSGTATYSFTLTPFSGTPTCVASENFSGTGIAAATAIATSATAAQVVSFNPAGNPAEISAGLINVICIGT